MGNKRTWSDAFDAALKYGPQAMKAAKIVADAIAPRRGRRRNGSDSSMKKKKTKSEMKMRKKRTSKVSLGATDSKSGGFFKKPLKKLSTLAKKANKGYLICRESGNVVSGVGPNPSDPAALAPNVYVGQSIFSRETLHFDICSSLVKSILNGAGIHWASDQAALLWNTPAIGQVTLTFEYQENANQDGNVSIQRFTIVPASDPSATTPYELILAVHNFFTQKITEEFSFIRAYVAVGTQILPTYMTDLTTATVSIEGKSSLKIQNRTTSVTGSSDADDVDVVPVYGKFYEGRGNHLALRERTAITTTYDIRQGLRYVCADDVLNKAPSFEGAASHELFPSFQEPPYKNALINVKSQGKAHLDPGQIKTSVITFKRSYLLNKLLRSMPWNSTYTVGTPNPIFIGKYRLFLFEKMITAIATSETNVMKIAYEHDVKTGVVVRLRKMQTSNMMVFNNPL